MEEKIINSIIEEAYEVLAFPPGGAPLWERFMKLFHRNAIMGLRVFPQDEEVSILNVLEYAKAQMENNLKEEGYSETPEEKTIEIIGDIAYVKQYFTMNFIKGKVRAVDIFLLANTKTGWKIISVCSDMVNEERSGTFQSE